MTCWHVVMLTSWHDDILTCCHVDILTCWYVDMLTWWHVDTLTGWHVDMLRCCQVDMMTCWHFDLMTCWHADKLTCWQEFRMTWFWAPKYETTHPPTYWQGQSLETLAHLKIKVFRLSMGGEREASSNKRVKPKQKWFSGQRIRGLQWRGNNGCMGRKILSQNLVAPGWMLPSSPQIDALSWSHLGRYQCTLVNFQRTVT